LGLKRNWGIIPGYFGLFLENWLKGLKRGFKAEELKVFKQGIFKGPKI